MLPLRNKTDVCCGHAHQCQYSTYQISAKYQDHPSVLKDYPGVFKERHTSCDDGLHPGDVFHPNFQHGRPAYFDISIHSTTQSTFISFSASCTGVAAAAKEVVKDENHLAAVEKMGSDFNQ